MPIYNITYLILVILDDFLQTKFNNYIKKMNCKKFNLYLCNLKLVPQEYHTKIYLVITKFLFNKPA